MRIDLAENALAILQETMEREDYPDLETTIVAGMLALRQSSAANARWWDSLGETGHRRIDELLAEADEDIAAGRLIPGEVAMQRARDLVERKRLGSTSPQ
jgi:hypothetical protein